MFNNVNNIFVKRLIILYVGETIFVMILVMRWGNGLGNNFGKAVWYICLIICVAIILVIIWVMVWVICL